jgi:hypothetical protein
MDELVSRIEGFFSRLDFDEITMTLEQVDEEGRNVKQDIKGNPEFAERYFTAWGVPNHLRANPQNAIKWMKKETVIDTYEKWVYKGVDEDAILRPVEEAVARQENVDKILQEIRTTKKVIPWSLGLETS